jgi:hypothetical protein
MSALAIGLLSLGATATANAAPSGGAEVGSTSDTSVSRCTVSDLDAAIESTDAGAGHVEYELTFTNTSDDACKLVGYPGLSEVGGGDGTRLGNAASRTDDDGTPTVLKPNGHAVAELRGVNVDKDGGPLGQDCKATKADGFRIYPPNSKAAMYVPVKDLYGCTGDVDYLDVSGVHPV